MVELVFLKSNRLTLSRAGLVHRVPDFLHVDF